MGPILSLNGPSDQPGTIQPLELVELCWQMGSLQSRRATCRVASTATTPLALGGAGYSEEHLRRSQRTAEIGSARKIAEAWRQAVLAKGGFTELTGDQRRGAEGDERRASGLRAR
jgi:hypothetical protein